MRNLANTSIRKAKADFIKMNANRYEKDANKFWENINSLLPKKSKNTYINLLDRRKNKTIKCGLLKTRPHGGEDL